MIRSKILVIDPSFSTMGAGFFDMNNKQIISMKTGDFMDIHKYINAGCKLSEITMVIENPALNSNTFKMWGLVEDAIRDMVRYMFSRSKLFGFPAQFVGKTIAMINLKLRKGQQPVSNLETTIDDVRSKFSIAMNYAQKVGENKAAAKLMIKMMEVKGVPIIEIAPSQRKRADKIKLKAGKAKVNWSTVPYPTKMTAMDFKEFCGYEGRSSEHSRDAMTLIIGKDENWIERMLPEKKKVPENYPRSSNGAEFIVKRDKTKQI